MLEFSHGYFQESDNIAGLYYTSLECLYSLTILVPSALKND